MQRVDEKKENVQIDLAAEEERIRKEMDALFAHFDQRSQRILSKSKQLAKPQHWSTEQILKKLQAQPAEAMAAADQEKKRDKQLQIPIQLERCCWRDDELVFSDLQGDHPANRLRAKFSKNFGSENIKYNGLSATCTIKKVKYSQYLELIEASGLRLEWMAIPNLSEQSEAPDETSAKGYFVLNFKNNRGAKVIHEHFAAKLKQFESEHKSQHSIRIEFESQTVKKKSEGNRIKYVEMHHMELYCEDPEHVMNFLLTLRKESGLLFSHKYFDSAIQAAGLGKKLPRYKDQLDEEEMAEVRADASSSNSAAASGTGHFGKRKTPALTLPNSTPEEDPASKRRRLG